MALAISAPPARLPIAAFNNVDTGFALDANHSFAIAARTGGAYEELYIDNLKVQWIPEPSSSALLGGCLSALLLLHRRK
jgi:ABC-type nitrate/sulfonate/bicarbonate transport system substrate-binding protein